MGNSWDEVPTIMAGLNLNAGATLVMPDGKFVRAAIPALNELGLRYTDDLRASMGQIIASTQMTATAAQTAVTGLQNSVGQVMSDTQERVAANYAEFTDFKQVQADQNASFAQSIQTLNAALGSANGARTYLQSTAPDPATIPGGLYAGDLWFDTGNGYSLHRWDGSTWVQTDNTAIAANTAAISTEASTRADAINGITARWGVTVDTNGNVAGIQLLSGQGGSAFNIRADSFSVTMPGYGTQPVFQIGSNNGVATITMHGNIIQDGSIGNNQIGYNSVDGGKIQPNAIGASHLQSNAVGQAAIQNSAVVTAHIVQNAVTMPYIFNQQGGVYGTNARQLIAIVAVTPDADCVAQTTFNCNLIWNTLATQTFTMEVNGGADTLAGVSIPSSNPQASVTLMGARQWSAGQTYTVSVYWTGPTDTLCGNIVLSMLAAKR